jgi:hypothetical protein
VLSRDGVASDPDILAKWLGNYANNVARVVMLSLKTKGGSQKK